MPSITKRSRKGKIGGKKRMKCIHWIWLLLTLPREGNKLVLMGTKLKHEKINK